MDLVADLSIGGERFTKTLTTAPLTVHSDAASSVYSYAWDGHSWSCGARSPFRDSTTVPESLRTICTTGNVFSEQDASPPSPADATATGHVVSVAAAAGPAPPAVGSAITLTRKGDVFTDSVTHASFCRPGLQTCGS